MRTILHAILDAALCADSNKQSTPALRGVALKWVEVPHSEVFYRPVLRCCATDGKAMAVTYCDPGDNAWPQHEEIIVSAEGIKVLGQLAKRVDKLLSERAGNAPIKATLETWCDMLDGDGRQVNPRPVLRIDVPAASDGVVVPLVPKATYPNIEGVMTPRRVWLGTPKGILSTDYAQAAQDAVGYFGPPLWYTDDRVAFLFNKHEPERSHDFALVVPVTPGDAQGDLWPWGRPTGAVGEPAGHSDLAQAVDGEEPIVVEGIGLDEEEVVALGGADGGPAMAEELPTGGIAGHTDPPAKEKVIF